MTGKWSDHVFSTNRSFVFFDEAIVRSMNKSYFLVRKSYLLRKILFYDEEIVCFEENSDFEENRKWKSEFGKSAIGNPNLENQRYEQ